MSTAIFDFTRSRPGRFWARIVAAVLFAVVLAVVARPLLAQAVPAAAPVTAEQPTTAREAASAAAAAPTAAEPAAATVAEGSTATAAPGASAYTPMKPTPGVGMPVAGGFDTQKQFSPTGRFAYKFHIGMFWVMVAISVFVLALLLYVMWRFRAKANPVPSRTTHHTGLEVAWTLVPVLILVAIAIPSISLLQQQYRAPPANAITIKATGYQWYWGYSYPDNGEFEVISNMLKEKDDVAPGERFRTDDDGPAQLAADNRMVVPVGVPLRIQTTAADVIHAFAVPSLWFKIDAVPGRLNERLLTIEKPGVYYGQCSELCGARHGYMPIVVEALPMDQWRAWVRAQGGTFADEAVAAPAAAPSAAPLQDPESAVPNAAGAGAPPVAPATPTPAA